MKILSIRVLVAVFTLCSAGQAMAQAIVGPWIVSGRNTKAEGAAVLIFTASGHYYQIQNALESEGPNGFDGFERGTYTWNSTTGALSFVTLLDNNGDVGVSAPGGVSGLRVSVAGNTAIVTTPDAEYLLLNRVTSSIPLVGAWISGSPAQTDNSAVLVFLPNGVYFMAQDGDVQPAAQDGIEHGTYAWNDVTGQLTSRRTPAPYVDTNGDFGLSETNDQLIFTVANDVLTLSAEGETEELTRIGTSAPDPEELQINAGMDGAWYNPVTAGQGFFISVFPDVGQLFLAWFTYDLERPPGSVTADLGDPGHRWLTAFGTYSGNQAELAIEITEGGIFDTTPPSPTQSPDGTIILEFNGCNAGTVTYNIPSIARQGVVPIERLALDNMLLCESLQTQ